MDREGVVPGTQGASVYLEEEEELLMERCRQAEIRLNEQQHSLGELRKELSHKGALVEALRASLKDKERRFLEELKHRSHRITVLNTELQKQTEAAAYLSFQLHAARQKLHQQHRHGPRGSERQPLLPPPPPPPPAAAGKPKRRSYRAAAHHLRAERARECVPRERVTGPEEPTAMPDPALFLYPRRHRPRPRPHGAPAQRQRGAGRAGEGDQQEAGARPRETAAPAAANSEQEEE
ncbi:coiled-coil domain-containing 92B isoform X2 [Lepisosteus oculatus]|uniref:coiled-coil domain-containing 92B isoform X2 n=1 Tax=Lepisosteus oculatus TaxID=7918 RepID=UPI003717BD97